VTGVVGAVPGMFIILGSVPIMVDRMTLRLVAGVVDATSSMFIMSSMLLRFHRAAFHLVGRVIPVAFVLIMDSAFCLLLMTCMSMVVVFFWFFRSVFPTMIIHH
jgi:hypothetical protein